MRVRKHRAGAQSSPWATNPPPPLGAAVQMCRNAVERDPSRDMGAPGFVETWILGGTHHRQTAAAVVNSCGAAEEMAGFPDERCAADPPRHPGSTPPPWIQNDEPHKQHRNISGGLGTRPFQDQGPDKEKSPNEVPIEAEETPSTNRQRTPSKPRPKANYKGWDTLPTTSQTTAGNDKSTGVFPNPATMTHIHPSLYPTSACPLCGAHANLAHIIWACPQDPFPEIPSEERWEASLRSPDPDLQARLVKRAEEVAGKPRPTATTGPPT
ncbi:hypothetical protein HPB47_004115 [Ixodes persulcatus]|uniref:Uncharacterized protein n=2 Tax=Ixodes persulcatus TaxID=34615 RepID=A0AC60PGM0_IXOPE|nr:hypothetical protein HPB47_004115 [Ixodes persulcatus]